MPRSRRNLAISALAAAGAISLLAACGGAGSGSGTGGAGGVTTVTVATAAVPQFDDVRALTETFEQQHPAIRIEYVNLPEDQLRDQLTQGVATGSSPFDVIAVGPYEVPIWSKNGWLEDLAPYAEQDADYDVEDILPTVRKGLGSDGKLFAVPFSGESSMLMYRKDLFEAKGIEMPANPSWTQVAQLAAQVEDEAQGIQGICMRGSSSWGSSLAALNPIINTFGGVWYDQAWTPQFSSPETKRAVQFYVDLQREHGGPSAASNGFPECLTAFGQGKAAMWFDATSAGASVEDPKTSTVAGKVGYAPAPVESFDSSGWLWSWNVAMPVTSENKDAAWAYMRWASSKEYVALVGEKLGLVRTPTATRESTYADQAYLDGAPFAEISLASVRKADPTQHPKPVPYTGVLFLGLPTYQDFGTQVSQQISAAVAGNQTVDEAVANADKILAGVAEDNKAWVEGS
ncbi:ABC transporter substrate-binding protein [Pseudonocardia nigra]|uniref:ABC transporter substrate-binding protein n=1 Tax=Pseudonocardia nigra TaxID=1921578 RepID=UPI001C5F006D|nr:sugar ABC transporter substrate-binding protein [Pseudonocardia nigra]